MTLLLPFVDTLIPLNQYWGENELCVLLVMIIFCFTVWIVVLLTQKGSWIWFYLIKSVDVVINTRTLWLWYFECDLAVPYVTQEDCWWKATSVNTKDKKYEFCLTLWITESGAIEQWFCTKAIFCFHTAVSPTFH